MRLVSVLLAAGLYAMAQSRGGGGMAAGMPGRGTPGGMPSLPGGMPGGRPPAAGFPGFRPPFLPPPLFNPFPFPTFAAQLAATTQGWPSGIFTPPIGPWSNGSFGGGYGGGYPGFGGGGYFGDSGFYPPQYSNPPQVYPNSPQPANVTVIVPPQPMPAPIVLPKEAPAAEVPQAPPLPERIVPTEFPALISIRNGYVYSASTYWTKGKTFHFITTQGEHIQVPVSQLERLYAPQKDGRPVTPSAAGR
jgi:hypothetical protein